MKLQRVQKVADKELRFQPQIYQRKHGAKPQAAAIKTPNVSEIKGSSDNVRSDGAYQDSINRDLCELKDSEDRALYYPYQQQRQQTQNTYPSLNEDSENQVENSAESGAGCHRENP